MLVHPQTEPLDCTEWQAEGVVVFVDFLEKQAQEKVGLMRAICSLVGKVSDL